MALSTIGCFSQASFRFLRALARHNEREWFLAHKTEFDMYLRQLRLQLIADLAGPLLTHALDVVPTDRLWVNPDCGLKTRG